MRRDDNSVPSIYLVHDSPTERALERELLELFEKYPLDRWFYTEALNIEDGVIPHSHPVLTLSPKTRGTTYLGQPERLLGCYIHEQVHWFDLLDDPAHDLKRADTEFRTRYPNLPFERPEGCGSETSNYLHIGVNFWEYEALRTLLGLEQARAVLESIPHYTAIYALVLRDYEQIGAALRESGMVVPEHPPEVKRFLANRQTRL